MSLLSLPAMAQWESEGYFPPELLETHGTGIHGIAVDPDGKIWIQPHMAFAGNEEVVQVPGIEAPQASPVLYVYNPDGTQADFSPIRFIDYAEDTGFARDTLGGFRTRSEAGVLGWSQRIGRGLATDHEGNIIVSQQTRLYKLDYQTGQGLARGDHPAATSAAATDAEGNIYVTNVVGGAIRIYDTNLNFTGENVAAGLSGVSRTLLATADGTVLHIPVDRPYATIYQRPGAFQEYDSLTVSLRGLSIESATVHPVTGQIWVSSGNESDLPNRFEAGTSYRSHTWYAFELEDLLASQTPAPRDSIVLSACASFSEANICLSEAGTPVVGRPRGIAFSPDGETAYVALFTIPGPNIERFSFAGETSNEPGAGAPELFTISQNYPNPFQSSTQIEFSVERPGHVSLRVYDLLGREVAVLVDEVMAATTHTATLRADGLASGTYMYVLEQDGQRLSSRRMQVVK